MVLTDQTKFLIQGRKSLNHFKVVDLREGKSGYVDSCAFFGQKEAAMLTREGTNGFAEWEGAPVLVNGQRVWIEGMPMILVAVDPEASNGVSFVEERLFKAIQKIEKVEV